MDWADRAKDLTELENAAILAAYQARARPTGPSASHCVECGDLIPEARRQINPGVQLCTQHQAEKERQRKR